MHPALSAFPNARFYAGRLVDGVRPQQRLPPKGLRLPVQGVPMVMLDVHGQEVGSSNYTERSLCLTLSCTFSMQGLQLTSRI